MPMSYAGCSLPAVPLYSSIYRLDCQVGKYGLVYSALCAIGKELVEICCSKNSILFFNSTIDRDSTGSESWSIRVV